MSTLVEGGLGYIGSHAVVALIEAGYSVVIADNLSNSNLEVLDALKQITNEHIPFYQIDVTDEQAVNHLFEKHSIEGVIHFAGYKAVGESVSQPLKYYRNNLLSTIILVNACKQFNVKKFVFSSLATVYGDNEVPFKETMSLLPTINPYGETKAMGERILKDLVNSDPSYSSSTATVSGNTVKVVIRTDSTQMPSYVTINGLLDINGDIVPVDYIEIPKTNR